jgi:hypothetical protein
MHVTHEYVVESHCFDLSQVSQKTESHVKRYGHLVGASE